MPFHEIFFKFLLLSTSALSSIVISGSKAKAFGSLEPKVTHLGGLGSFGLIWRAQSIDDSLIVSNK